MDLIEEVKSKAFHYKDSWGAEYYLLPVARNYNYNERLAIELYDIDQLNTYSILTVNLPELYIHDPTTCAFVDTNNFEDGLKIIEELGLGKSMGVAGRSGYCIYPLYEFDTNKLFQERELFDYEVEKKERLDNLEDLFFQEHSNLTDEEAKELIRAERISIEDLEDDYSDEQEMD